MTPQERADRIRKIHGCDRYVMADLLPPGSVVLTREEVEAILPYLATHQGCPADVFALLAPETP